MKQNHFQKYGGFYIGGIAIIYGLIAIYLMKNGHL